MTTPETRTLKERWCSEAPFSPAADLQTGSGGKSRTRRAQSLGPGLLGNLNVIHTAQERKGVEGEEARSISVLAIH